LLLRRFWAFNNPFPKILILMNIVFIKNICIGLVLSLMACNKQPSQEKQAQQMSKPLTKVTYAPLTTSKQVVFTQAQYQFAGIKTGRIEQRSLSNIIKLNGVVDIEPKNSAIVSAPIGGYIKTAGLLPGEVVTKGQVLATIEHLQFIELQQNYLVDKKRLEYVKKEYQRQRKLREEDINATKTFEKIASEYEILEATLAGLTQKLALIGIDVSRLQQGNITKSVNLYAPISGYIKASNVILGNYVSPKDELFEIVNPDGIHLSLNAYEKDIVKVAKGQDVRFALANDKKFERSASIFLVGKAVQQNQTVPVHCHIDPKSQHNLLPGMYVKAWIATNMHTQATVPSEAIVQLENKDYLIFQKSNSDKSFTFQFRRINKGVTEGRFTAVELPASAESKVSNGKLVTKNAYTILSALINSEETE